jgi:hypothetical protein
MNTKTKLSLILGGALALALPLAAQMRMGMGSPVPNLSGIWRPVVGNGASYQITRNGKTTALDFTVVGKEDVDGKTAYWMEVSMNNEAGMNGEMIVKVLETVEGNTITSHRWIMQMPGRPPMEMDSTMMNRGGQANQAADLRDKAELVGTESITVPAGTFTCEHYHMKDGSGDGWISDKVSPWSLVKMEDKEAGRTMVLAKVITDAKDRITGTPVKFDPMQMMRDRMGQQGQ